MEDLHLYVEIDPTSSKTHYYPWFSFFLGDPPDGLTPTAVGFSFVSDPKL
jgi:hypothetical protein